MAICAGECGENTAREVFRPGHDSHLRAAAEHGAGGVISLANLVEAAESFAADRLTLDDFGERVKVLMPKVGLPAA
jgi:hypothetical protein